MPTIHLGPAVTALERRGRSTEAGQEQEQKRRDDIGVREECDGYLKARKPFTLESLLKQVTDELAQGEVGLRKGIVRDTPDYARKIKEIRALEAEIKTKERHLETVRYRLTECEEEISEWAEGVSFFARLFPPHEIRETKERRVEAQSDLRETTGLLSLLKAAFEQVKKLFKEWFLTEVNSPKLEDRWRWRSQALIGIQHECEAKLAQERNERAKAREAAELKRYREEEDRWKAQQAEKEQKSKDPVVEPKQEVEPSQFGAKVPDDDDEFDDDWDDSPSFSM